MPDQNDRSPVYRPSGQVTKLSAGGQQIVSGMINDTLELARCKQELSTEKRYKIGEHELCEPDYLQVLEWAKLAETQPDVFLDEILDVNYSDKNSIVNGKIQAIFLQKFHANIKTFSFSYILEIKSLTMAHNVFEPIGALEQIDLSKATELKKLWCPGNQLIELDVSNLTELEDLNCYGNQLIQLDVSNNTKLKKLWCSVEIPLPISTYASSVHGLHQLTELDVSNLTELEVLNCNGNQLSQLDVSNNTELKRLLCGVNQLTELDVSNLSNLKELFCSVNQLTELDVSNLTELEKLGCVANQLSQLDVSFLNDLETVNYDNHKTKLIKRDDQNF